MILAAVADQAGPIGVTLASVQVLSLIVGTVLPILVGLVTKTTTHPGVRAVLLALLSGVSGILTEYLGTSGGFDWGAAALTWLATFMVAVATHFGILKPTGVSAAMIQVGSPRR